MKVSGDLWTSGPCNDPSKLWNHWRNYIDRVVFNQESKEMKVRPCDALGIA